MSIRFRSFRPLLVAAVVVAALSVSAFRPRAAAPLSPRFNHVMLYVSDLDASIAFYTKAFDLKVTQRIDTLTVTQADGSEVTRQVKMAFLKFPGQDFTYELSERAAPRDNPSPFFQHVGVDVLDIAAAAERVKAAGGRDFSGIATVRAPGTVAKNAFFKGPDGELVELMQLVSGEF